MEEPLYVRMLENALAAARARLWAICAPDAEEDTHLIEALRPIE